MQELSATFTPADGGPSRAITLRIGTPYKGPRSWCVTFEVLGFDEPHKATTQGEDWAQAIELAAMVLPVLLQCKVRDAGGGTLEPSFYERDPQPPDLSKLPPEVVEALCPEG